MTLNFWSCCLPLSECRDVWHVVGLCNSGDWAQTSCMQGKHSTNWATSLTPDPCIFFTLHTHVDWAHVICVCSFSDRRGSGSEGKLIFIMPSASAFLEKWKWFRGIAIVTMAINPLFLLHLIIALFSFWEWESDCHYANVACVAWDLALVWRLVLIQAVPKVSTQSLYLSLQWGNSSPWLPVEERRVLCKQWMMARWGHW